METIFTRLIDQRKLEKRRKEVRIICDFLNFLTVMGLKCYTEVDMGSDGKHLIPVELTPEQIDVWLLKFYEILDSKK